MAVLKFFPVEMENVCGFFSRATVPAVCQDDAADVPEKCGDLSQGSSSSELCVYLPAVPFDEREREENRDLRRNSATLPEHVVKDGFQFLPSPIRPHASEAIVLRVIARDQEIRGMQLGISVSLQ